ncbi:hypothetical protein Tco_0704975 [Tanacetum coccineum]|uniref:Uncharacterized protein n=1 Tax=Tanacetum coccineum TaxID=301880 RepID=A0ABQ4Y3C6_9ASTR
MAGSDTANVIARRTIDDIAKFSGETETPKYMKVFILQEIAEARHFIRVQQMEATNDQDEYYNSLRCLRDSWRIGKDKIRGLNETIAAAEEEISILESHLEIMDAAINFE